MVATIVSESVAGPYPVQGLLDKLHALNTLQVGINQKLDTCSASDREAASRLVTIQLRLFEEANAVAQQLCSKVAGSYLEATQQDGRIDSVFDWLLQMWSSRMGCSKQSS